MQTEQTKIILRDLTTIRLAIMSDIKCSADVRAYDGVTQAIDALQDELEVRSMLALKEFNDERTDQ